MTTTTKPDPRASDIREAEIKARVCKELEAHVVRPEGDGRWLCARPDPRERKGWTWNWAFRVVVAPGLVVLYGDIYELVLRTHADALGWLLGSASCSTSYWLEKIPHEFRRPEEFSKDLARELIREAELDSSKVAELLEFVDDIDEDDRDAVGKWHDAWLDLGFDCHEIESPTLPAFWTLAQIEALRWFVRNLPAEESR